MYQDPRDKNQIFEATNLSRYLNEYIDSIAYGLGNVNHDELKHAAEVIRLTTVSGGRIFVGGNGGSSSISDHLVCDFVKGTYRENKPHLKVHSLLSSMALLTALGNDFGYEHIFKFQLEATSLTSNDVVILISSSGNSPNIIKALNFAKEVKAMVIGMTGFYGGELNKHADIKLHVPFNNYGVIEDCHQSLMHILAQWYYLKTEDKK